MCKCDPRIRTPFCGCGDCLWPEQKSGPKSARSTAYAAAFVALLPLLREVAREHGYALAVHGSMARDLDLVAVPWTDEATDAPVLIEALRASFDGVIRDERQFDHNPAWKPHGRLAWSIYLGADSGPYLDVSVMPRQPRECDLAYWREKREREEAAGG